MKRLLFPLLLLSLSLCHCGRSLNINSKGSGQGPLNGNLDDTIPDGGGANQGGGGAGGDGSPSTGSHPGYSIRLITDTGRNGADGITNDNTPTFHGWADPNVVVWIEMNGVEKGRGSANAQGEFLITVSPVSDGSYSVRGRWMWQGQIRSTPTL